jgi:hypothetical protein
MNSTYSSGVALAMKQSTMRLLRGRSDDEYRAARRAVVADSDAHMVERTTIRRGERDFVRNLESRHRCLGVWTCGFLLDGAHGSSYAGSQCD